LEITEARKNVQIAQVSYNQAKNSYERRRELFDRSLISRSEFEQDEQLYEEEKLRLGLQKERLSLLQKGRAGGPDSQVLSQVRSPIAGTVLERFVDRGDPVVPPYLLSGGHAALLACRHEPFALPWQYR
jgi:HlyD family secretion protein